MMKKIALILVVVLVAFIGWRWLSAPSPVPIAERQVASGALVGFDTGRGSLAWLGIPFARAPVDELRWRPPQPVEPWSGTREALSHPPFCKQVLPFSILGNAITFGDEDCLYLNVWTPSMDSAQARDAELPVMVWIHGGANTLGGSAAADPHRFAEEEGVVVVSLQYRLGILGWFSHPALRQMATTVLDKTANFAVLDMIAALQWVQTNIGEFGGNAGNVTIFGQSAGAFDVLALLGSPQAEGLFHKAIAQSGNIHTVPRSKAENYSDDAEPGLPHSNREFINRLLVADGRAANREQAKALQESMSAAELLAYLRDMPADDLFDGVLGRGNLGYFTPTNIRDGIVLPNEPLLEVFSDPGRHNQVPVILGSNRDEYKLWLSGLDEMVASYLGLWKTIRDPARYERLSAYFSDQWQVVGVSEPARALQSAAGSEVYTYRLEWADQPAGLGANESDLYGAAHGIEVVFLFGRDPVSHLPKFTRTDNEPAWQELSDRMLRYWANFARDGKPAGGPDSGLPQWDAWTATEPGKLLLDVGEATRMAQENIFAADLKARLRNDPAIESARERCELYAQLFRYGLSTEFWDDGEYSELGCDPYPVEKFSGLI